MVEASDKELFHPKSLHAHATEELDDQRCISLRWPESEPSSLQPQRRASHASRSSARALHNGTNPGTDYDIPDLYTNLDKLVTPLQNPNKDLLQRHLASEETRSPDQEQPVKVSRFVTQLYTISYLILFAILGTLARLGLQRITLYPGAPLIFSALWANFGGSFFMGFLIEDRMLFGHGWVTSTSKKSIERNIDEESRSRGSDALVDSAAANQAHTATKKAIPLFIGLTTGFCGSFTSFSSFIRDAFLALSNGLPTPISYSNGSGQVTSTVSIASRNGGYSFMALVAVVTITVAMSISGFHVGVHLAVALEPYTPSLPHSFICNILDCVVVVIAWGCWLGAVLFAIWPPDRNSDSVEVWRGRAVFAIVLAPLGCLGRFFISLYLNGKIVSFPLGTFVVNVAGTVILGIIWDLQHLTVGGVIGCQVFQGVEDGFCGCLTTVSTWVTELSALRKSHAYKYGSASVIVALCFLVVIMGSLRWTKGFTDVLCVN